MTDSSDKWVYFGIGAVTLLIIAVAVFFATNTSKPKDVSSQNLVKEDSNTLGSKEAKVVIVEFSDFECPACRAANPIVKEITKEYGDKILFAYRHFPLVATHRYALKAAEAAEAAGEQGKFWEYQDTLFEHQENLKTEDLKKYAQELELDMEKFNESLDSGKFKDKVTTDLDDGENAGVRATPTFFINGEKHQGTLNLDEFRKQIDKRLNE